MVTQPPNDSSRARGPRTWKIMAGTKLKQEIMTNSSGNTHPKGSCGCFQAMDILAIRHEVKTWNEGTAQAGCRPVGKAETARGEKPSSHLEIAKDTHPVESENSLHQGHKNPSKRVLSHIPAVCHGAIRTPSNFNLEKWPRQ